MGATCFHYTRLFTSLTLTFLQKRSLSKEVEQCKSHPYCRTLNTLQFTSISLMQQDGHAFTAGWPCIPQPRQTSASNKEHALLLQNQAKCNLFHLTQPGVPFFMIKAFTSSKAKCEFLAFQRKHFHIHSTRGGYLHHKKVDSPFRLQEPVREIRVLDPAK